MKKLILAAAAVFGTLAFTACTKENVSQMHKASVLADKGNLGQADFNGDTNPLPPTVSDKGNLGQADGEGQ